MGVATPNKMQGTAVGASLFAPVTPQEIYEAVLDVRRFPAWAPGVWRVEVFSGEGAAGMLSEWEVSFLGLRHKVTSVLEEAQSPTRLRWTYAGPLLGWGECSVGRFGDGTLAEFRTSLSPADPLLARLARGETARSAARAHLKRALLKLGHLVAGDETRVLVGPVTAKRHATRSP